MKDTFIIKDIVAMKSNKDDRVTAKYAKFKGVNVRITLNKVIDINRGIVSKDNEILNVGNTNPRGCDAFDVFVKGFEISKQTDHNGKPYERVCLLSDDLIKGAMFEFEYTIRMVGDKPYIVPTAEAKYKGFQNPKKIIKSSAEPLF